MSYYIYRITNSLNDKIYIGYSGDPDKRWKVHLWLSGRPDNRAFSYIHRSMRKNGANNFSFELFDETETEEEAKLLEKFWISEYKSNQLDCGYNLTEGGDGTSGYLVTKEQRAFFSKLHSDRPRKPVSEETRNKIKKARQKQKRIILPVDFKNEVLQDFRTYKYTKKQLANKYGVPVSTIKSICRSKVDKFKSKISLDSTLRGILKKIYRVFSLLPNYRYGIYKTKSQLTDIKKRQKIIKKYFYGREIPQIILNDQIKKDILELRKLGPFRIVDLAEIFDLKEKTVKYIVARYTNSGVLTREQRAENRARGAAARRGKKLSKETRQKISIANRGRIITKETRQKISIANSKENNGMYNKTHSKNTRAKMSESQSKRKRRPMTEDEKARISNALKGRPKPGPVPQEIKKQVIEMYSSNNYTKKQLSIELGLKYNTVVGILRKK